MKTAKSSKAIQTILTKHQDELFALINDGASISELDAMVTKCLDEAEATGNKDVPEARIIFANSTKRGYNHYLSTLMAYLTGIAVGK